MKIKFKMIKGWFVNKMNRVDFLAIESGIAIDDIILEKETDKAICVSTEWNGYRKNIWFPKSVIEYTVV